MDTYEKMLQDEIEALWTEWMKVTDGHISGKALKKEYARLLGIIRRREKDLSVYEKQKR